LLKKSITYENPFTNQEVTEEHYFHISKADLVQMEMEEHGFTYQQDGKSLTGMQAKLQKIIDSQDGRAIMVELRDIIRRSYGKKEGDRFIKSPEIWEHFASTEAYSQLIFDLCTNAEAAAEFMSGIIPNNLEKIAAEVRAITEKEEETETPESLPSPTKQPWGNPEREQEVMAATPENPVELTRVDLTEMNDSDLRSGLAEGRYKLS
jgi:hypothetical protein